MGPGGTVPLDWMLCLGCSRALEPSESLALTRLGCRSACLGRLQPLPGGDILDGLRSEVVWGMHGLACQCLIGSEDQCLNGSEDFDFRSRL